MTRVLLSRWLAPSALIGCWLVSSHVHAQGWLADRELTEGRGIRVGDLELHPGIGTEVGYDSNVYRDDLQPIGSGMVRVSPHLAVSTLGQQRSESDRKTPPAISFRGQLGAQGYVYFADATPPPNFESDFGGDLVINPDRPVSIALMEQFTYGFRPFAQSRPGTRDQVPDFRRIRNLTGARLQFQSSGGIFRTSFGYNFSLDRFLGAQFAWANSMDHTGTATASWNFLPHTSLLYDLTVVHRSYTDPSGGASTGGRRLATPMLLSDGTRVSSRLGLNGALTQKVGLTLMAGYMGGFYTVGDDIDDVIGRVELRYNPQRNISFTLGYDRDVAVSQMGNFRRIDRAYTRLQAMVAGRFVTHAEVAGALHTFGAVRAANGMPLGSTVTRRDPTIDGTLFSEYRAADWFGINASLRYEANLTEYEYLLQPRAGGPRLIDPAQFDRVEAWLGLRAFY